MDASVGAMSPNRPDDVHLTRYAHSPMATLATVDAELHAACARVNAGNACTGGIGDSGGGPSD